MTAHPQPPVKPDETHQDTPEPTRRPVSPSEAVSTVQRAFPGAEEVTDDEGGPS